MKHRNHILFSLLLICSCAAANAVNTIIVDKPGLMLYVCSEEGDTVFSAPVACGRNLGDKQRRGDNRTPEGTFSVSQIQDSRSWLHDNRDGLGPVKGCYGPWFIRIRHPKWTSIGIHGTRFPKSIGTRASEGCIRLNNEKVVELLKYVSIGSPVIIHPDRRTR